MTAFRNEIGDDIRKVGGFAREIVAKRMVIIGVITIILNLAVAYGVFNDITSNEVLGWVTSALDALAAIVAIVTIRPAVTPVSDPRTDDGTPLVPLTKKADPLVAVANDGPLDQHNAKGVELPAQDA